jgi:hypothetical protein
MISTYGRQLVSARRLARFKRALAAAGLEDEVSLSRQARRRHLVERIAREIVENLLVTESDNPVVQEVRRRIEAEFGEKFELTYPPAEPDMKIFKITEQGPVEVEGEEKNTILSRLWRVTLEVVDDTML